MATDPAQTRRGLAGRWPRQVARPRRPVHVALFVLFCAGLAVFAWVDAAAAPFSRGALAGVLIPGAVLGAIALGRPPERIPPPDRLDIIGMSYWMICLAAFFEWEASAWRDNSWPWHPSFTNLIDPLLAPHLVKSAAILVWLLAGWALVRR
jgi:hypothetical protein